MTYYDPYEDPYSTESLHRLKAQVDKLPKPAGPPVVNWDIKVAAQRIHLEVDVRVVEDPTLHARSINGQYHGIDEADGCHLVSVAPEVTGWRRVQTLCHEFVHCRQREVLGPDFHVECVADVERCGNTVEGAHEREAYEKGQELAMTFYPDGWMIVDMPCIVPKLS